MTEYFWYITAAALAGIGTGLAGLSAATVMVPILIVMCPSFSGETGAYQATAIALASDILGSAVTTSVYIRHKNIDLKRGWIMLVCILSMCTLGSYAAWRAGNVVLGSFTLFLTFCIGIRFLIKPDTQRQETVSPSTSLDRKGVLISLFFGLTIGFGTGFVGTGGGMMMLVVFTAFLGMELKTAVGTSTFIMTFTALIASISHIVIHPAIILDRWNVLLICIVVATAASLISAQFANRVNSRTVGLVTGAVLTTLGAVMILLHYREVLVRVPLLTQTAVCFVQYLFYIIPAACILILLHYVFGIKKEFFRKLLHTAAFTSTPVVIYLADSWQAAALVLALFALIVYPILKLAEHWSGYSELFVQRRTGEIKNSLLLLFLSGAVLTAVYWGILDVAYIASASTLMWGFGDASAALVGKRFGKHHTHLRFADPKKTWEGTGSMALVSSLVGIACLAFMHFPWYVCVIAAIPAALCGAYTELISHNGNDTVTVPAATSVALSLMLMLLYRILLH